jgi:hypothetical protein
MIRPMTIADVELLKFKEDWMADRYRQAIQANVGPAFIMEDESGPLCAFGAAIIWNGMWCGGAAGNTKGVCEAWYVLIDKRKILSQMKEVRKCIVGEAKRLGLHRVQATVKKDFETGIKFLEFLGFKNETPDHPDGTPGGMEGYIPDGSTALMYSRIL